MSQDLGDGLIARSAEPSDVPRILTLLESVHGKEVARFAERLFKLHPTFTPQDSFVVVDTTRDSTAVSYLCLVPLTLVLDGTEIPTAQMELVATLPAYRHRGLIRALNHLFELRAAELGLQLFVIAGIEYFYRRFDYEYAVPLQGTLAIPTESVPDLKKGESDVVRIERVTQRNFPEYLQCREKRNSYLNLYRKVTLEDCAFLLAGTLGEEVGMEFYMVKRESVPVGIFNLGVAWNRLEVRELWADKVDYLAPVLRFARDIARKRGLPLHVGPPSKEALVPYLERVSGSRYSRPYAWYVKIPSIGGFLKLIGRVLEKRIEDSDLICLTENLKISWYWEGVELVFVDGKLKGVKDIPRVELAEPDLRLPPVVINQLLMGYRTLDELARIYPDVTAKASKVPVVNVLFPRMKANLMPEV